MKRIAVLSVLALVLASFVAPSAAADHEADKTCEVRYDDGYLHATFLCYENWFHWFDWPSDSSGTGLDMANVP